MSKLIKNQVVRKAKPGYYFEQIKYKNANPLFIAIDWNCLNFIRDRNGICLLCLPGQSYHLEICKSKELWVLYSSPSDLNYANELGYQFLIHGATKVLLILVSHKLLGRNTLWTM